jgi:hypothetical protein
MTPDEWVCERFNERAREQGKQAAIYDGLPDLCKNLWAAITTLLESYNKNSRQEVADWSPFGPKTCWAHVGRRSVEVQDSMAGDPRKLELEFDAKKASVQVAYRGCPRGAKRSFSISVNETGQASFFNPAGSPVSVEEVARLIADPLLFPDLPPWPGGGAAE